MSSKINVDEDKLLKEAQNILKFESKEDRANFLSMIIQMDFLDEVQKFLDREGWSRTKLAKKLGVSKSFISQLFSGEKSFFNKNLIGKLQIILNKKIAISFDIPYKQIVIDLTTVDNRLFINNQQAKSIKKEYTQEVSTFNQIDFSNLETNLPS